MLVCFWHMSALPLCVGPWLTTEEWYYFSYPSAMYSCACVFRSYCQAFEFWWLNGQKMEFHCSFNLHFFFMWEWSCTSFYIIKGHFIFLFEFFCSSLCLFFYRPLSSIKKQSSINWELNPLSVMYALTVFSQPISLTLIIFFCLQKCFVNT